MLKENKRTLIITSIVTILPILIGVFLWNRLPDVMATHFGINNENVFICLMDYSGCIPVLCRDDIPL